MKVFIPSVVLASATFLVAVWCQAEQPIAPRDQTTQTTATSSSPASALAYAPPHRGAPAPGHRIGGGTRSFGQKGPLVSVLAPDHVGLTIHEQPSLYWYVSESVTTPVEVEITLIEADGVKPVLKARIPSPVGPGIQRVNLAEHGIHLTQGAHYEWSVALVLDPKRRSRDIVASGGIERVAKGSLGAVPSENLPKAELPGAYAQAGLWYDTIASVSDLIDTSPTDPAFRQQRATLLDTAGLKEASAFDRGK